MNLDYKYFAGSKDPIEIILKYRMRGFGTFLNRKEIDKAIKYIQQVPFWNNLYSINPDNKDTIKSSLGWLEYKHKLYHPRLFNMELFGYDIPFVNINDGYNNVEEKEVLTSENISQYMKNKFKVSKDDQLSSQINMLEFRTISSNGYVEPVKKWLIDTIFNLNKNEYCKLLKESDSEKDKTDITEEKKPNHSKLIEVIDSNSSSGIWSTASGTELSFNNQNAPNNWEELASPIVNPNELMEETIENYSDEPVP